MGRKCIICNNGRSLHQLPNPDRHFNLFLEWVRLCGIVCVPGRTAKAIYHSVRICRLHFPPHGRVLPKFSVPSINLPAPIEVPEGWFTPRTPSPTVLAPSLLVLQKNHYGTFHLLCTATA